MAKTISLSDAYFLLTQCSVIELEGKLLEPQLYELTSEGKNEFLCLSWTEIIEGEEVFIVITFAEEDNKHVKLNGNVLTLISFDDKVEEELSMFTKLFNDGK